MGSEVTAEDKKPDEDQGYPPGKLVGEELTPEKRGKKRDPPEEGDDGEELGNGRRRRRSSASASADGTTVERPSRERKTVERYSAVSPKKTSATKSLSIKEGSGTKLKDIPNVVFKLSKSKIDDNLQALHTLFFGRKSNVHNLKKNLFQFSGFVWPENEEKLRARLKEKLDKHNKDKLVVFCELLDIHILKASTKKEEITTKLLEFLESPHVTRDVILADKDKKSKKQRRKTKEEMSLNHGTKKQTKSSDTEVKNRTGRPKDGEEQEDEDGGCSTGSKAAFSGEEGDSDSEEEREHVNSEDEDGKDESKKHVGSKDRESEMEEISVEPKIKENTSPVKKGPPAKSAKIPTKTKKASVPAEDEPEDAVDRKQGSTKQQTMKVSNPTSKETAASVLEEGKKKSPRKGSSVAVSDSAPSSSSKPRKEDRKKAKSNEKPAPEHKKGRKKKEPKDTKKEQGEGTDAGPSSEELYSVTSNILKEVDFNTATLADILKQLGAHFKMNLMGRKAEVKDIIEDIINSMTEDEDEDTPRDDKEEDSREEGDGK